MKMNRDQFVDLMLTDQKTFARYARLFMDLGGASQQGFLDWCWERWLGGSQPSPHFTGFGSDFYSDSAGAVVLKEIRA